MPETIKTKLTGVSKDNENGRSRQEVIEEEVNEGDDLTLVREPENTHDKNAIAVYPDLHFAGDETDNRIGYLSTDLASRLAPLMDKIDFQHIDCTVLQITGEEYEGNRGVNVSLTVFTRAETEEKIAKGKAIIDAGAKPPVENQYQPANADPLEKPNFKRRIIDWWLGRNPKRGLFTQIGFYIVNLMFLFMVFAIIFAALR